MNLTLRTLTAPLTLAVLAWAGTASAQDAYPSRTVRILVPYTAGSTADITARVVAQKIATPLGQPVVVENRAGANGAVGMQATAQSKPDGYTLVVTAGSAMSAARALSKTMPYDPVKDFSPVSLLGTSALVLVVGKDFPANNIQEFISLVKSAPKDKYSYAAGGGLLQLSMEAMKWRAGLSMVGVNYKGPTEAAVDVMAGRVAILSAGLSAQMPFIKDGRMKAMAIFNARRHPSLPNVPTMIEAGYKDMEIVGWTGVFGPAGMPAAIVNRLSTEINKALVADDVKKTFDAAGFDAEGNTPAQFARFLTDDIARFEAIVKAAGIEKQ